MVHTGATWRILLNRLCAAAMRPVVKLLWTSIRIVVQWALDHCQFSCFYVCYGHLIGTHCDSVIAILSIIRWLRWIRAYVTYRFRWGLFVRPTEFLGRIAAPDRYGLLQTDLSVSVFRSVTTVSPAKRLNRSWWRSEYWLGWAQDTTY